MKDESTWLLIKLNLKRDVENSTINNFSYNWVSKTQQFLKFQKFANHFFPFNKINWKRTI